MVSALRLTLVISAMLLALPAAQADVIPPCMAHGRPIAQNNQQVLNWKTTTRNQFLERAHVQGLLVQAFPDRNGHDHFSIQIGPNPQTDLVEIIYNTEFGAIPQPRPGLHVEACGDYITSTQQAGQFPPSPDGAIVHWVHFNPSHQGHEDGYLAIEGHLFGMQTPPNGPPRFR